MVKRIKLLFVAGARPNFMKIAPLIRECDRRKNRFEYRIVHTGQHYDAAMSSVFFDGLGIPEPNYFLDVGSGTHSEQTARVMSRFEPICQKEEPDCVVVVGDVNSTLACTIVAKKLLFRVAHVEAGLRSGDRAMPEEINRVVTDSISDYLFVTEPSGVRHLEREGHSADEIYFVGHVMIDNLFFELEKLDNVREVDAASKYIGGLKEYGVVTLHRPSNVDSQKSLEEIMNGLNHVSESLDLIFPIHPRTKKRLAECEIKLGPGIHLLEPLGYTEFLEIWRNARVVLTDSGGLQEETTALGVPCLTLRENTERPITIEMGTNRLIGTSSLSILSETLKVLSENQAQIRKPDLWDGRASSRILDVLEDALH